MRFFARTEKALFISRPNRFTITCTLNRKVVTAFLPNPGRLWELLLPGTPVYLEKTSNAERSLLYTAVALEREGFRIVLHTHKTNEIARHLIETGSVPPLKGHEVIRGEVPRGNSRFDFLLRKNGQDMFLEVKSCTLFSKKVAMFPDAVTARGKKHLEELSRLSEDGNSCGILFLVHWPRAEVFLPDFHTDFEFARAMVDARERVLFLPVSVRWRADLSIRPSEAKLLQIPWQVLEKELRDRGGYLLILRLPADTELSVGSLGLVRLRKGFYVYVGSAKKNLSQRIERHRRLRKKLFWHIDFLRAVSGFLVALPVRSEDDLECDMAGAMARIADWAPSGFGSSDCGCPSHLFGFETHPLSLRPFHDLLQHFRMERLVDKYALTR